MKVIVEKFFPQQNHAGERLVFIYYVSACENVA